MNVRMDDGHRPDERAEEGCVAAIDIGTNTTNLLITNRSGLEIARMSTPTRLGTRIDSTSRFEPDAVERTLACLDSYREVLASHRVDHVRCVATSACRRAGNFSDFAASARSILGHDIELIDGFEEGRLGYLGAVLRIGDSSKASPAGNVPTENELVIDIGGGSTEISLGNRVPLEIRSLEVGAVRLTEKYLISDPPKPEELVNAIADVQDLLSDACREVPAFTRAARIIGCSGTILSIAAVEIGSADVPNGFVLSRPAVEDVFRTLATESLADRVHNPGLPVDRADIIVGGCCILVGILRWLEIDSVTISHGNILDGICRELCDAANEP